MAITVRELGTSFGCAGLLMVMLLGGLLANNGAQNASPVNGPREPTAVEGQRSEKTSKPAEPVQDAEAQRLAMTKADPQMQMASDAVALAINLNGHLCADVSNVEPAHGSTFEVTCVKRRDGSGRAKYLFDGETNEVTPL